MGRAVKMGRERMLYNDEIGLCALWKSYNGHRKASSCLLAFLSPLYDSNPFC